MYVTLLSDYFVYNTVTYCLFDSFCFSSQKLSAARRRAQQRQFDEHSRNTSNMIRRMESYPLPAQRLQNPHGNTITNILL